MERGLRIFEMEETANPVALAHSGLLHNRLPPKYAAMRERRANLKAVKNNNDDLWPFVALSDGPLVSGLFSFSFIFLPCVAATLTFRPPQQRVAVNAARSDPPTPRARARTRAAQRREQERAARKKERGIWRRERREQRDEEFRLHKQQGLSPRATSEDWSSGDEEEEESDGGGPPLRGGSLRPPHRESRRRQRSKRSGRARERPPLGGLRKGWRAPRRRRREPRRRPGARR
jgi:hypothetical protein